MVGDRDQETKLDLRFYYFKELKNLSNKDKAVSSEWQLSNPTEFG